MTGAEASKRTASCAENLLSNLVPKNRKRRTFKGIVTASVSIGALGLMVILAFLPIPWTRFGGAGYLGLFVASLLSGVIAFAPGPAWALVYSAAKVLDPTTVGLVGGTGLALGEIAMYCYGRYLLGKAAGDNLQVAVGSDSVFGATPRKKPWPKWWWAIVILFRRMAAWGDTVVGKIKAKELWLRWWWGPLMFIITTIPTPLFELASIVAGKMGIPILRYFIPVFLARLARALVIAWIVGGFPRW